MRNKLCVTLLGIQTVVSFIIANSVENERQWELFGSLILTVIGYAISSGIPCI